MHIACNKHARDMHVACNQHACDMQVACNKHACDMQMAKMLRKMLLGIIHMYIQRGYMYATEYKDG